MERQDRVLFWRELFSPWRSALISILLLLAWTNPFGRAWVIVAAGFAALFAGAFSASVQRRFIDKRFRDLWDGCQDRLVRFEEVLRRMQREKLAAFEEMPNTIRTTARALYRALRRADLTSFEVHRTERSLASSPPAWSARPTDQKSQELYQLADRNIAEYRQQYAGVMVGVERAEAQSAVFITTLDTLRMKMLSYRLAGRPPELDHGDFLQTIQEAKLQLESIDKALEELDLPPLSQGIRSERPPLPEGGGSLTGDTSEPKP